MKVRLITLLSVFLLIGCNGNETKNKDVIKLKSQTEKSTKKTLSKQKNTLVIDGKGVANVVITTNDAMKFDINKINVASGQKIRLTLKHVGQLDKRVMGHNVVILKKGVVLSTFAAKAGIASKNDYIPAKSSEIIAHTAMIGGGETTEIEFIAPEPGVYDYICSFPGHYAMMRGKLIVK
ncbi:MAG: azurin [Flavobacteriaceae bacterium]|nr:azurin [Flavobacteriaceae bacterium]